MSMPPIFSIKDGNLSFADQKILVDIELHVSHLDRVALVGRNGCGKSSLMKVISKIYELDSGNLYQDPSCNIAYLKQDVKNLPNIKIYDYLLKSLQEPETNGFLVDMILKNLQLDGNLNITQCSGGQIRRALLAHTLVQQPTLLLLDEPTNHLDIDAIEWLEEYIKNYHGAIVCISHDRSFLENITNKVWWLDRGELRASSKGFRHYDEWREEIIAIEESTLKKMNRKLEVETGWLSTGVTARRKRNQRRLAHLYHLRENFQNHKTKLIQAKSKLQVELLEEEKKSKFIIEAENISYSIANKHIVKDFSFKVKKGEKIGIIGSNGSGKSTFVKILIGELAPQSGKVKQGTNLEITYFDQHRTELKQDHTLMQTLCPGGGDHVFLKDRSMHVAAYLKNFMFDPKALNNKVSTLSGGESNRLLLAKSLINPGNLLILDEPTNDLDMDSLEMLLEILAQYDGTLIVVSHDRDFLERLVTRTIVFKDKTIVDLYGGYKDYINYYQTSVHAAETKEIKQKPKTVSNLEHPVDIPQEQNFATKLSYKYQRLIEVLPKEIEKLEQEIKDLEHILSTPDLYMTNYNKFQNSSSQLLRKSEELDKKILQWIEIEEM